MDLCETRTHTAHFCQFLIEEATGWELDFKNKVPYKVDENCQ